MGDRSELDAARWRRIVAGVIAVSKPHPPRAPFSAPPPPPAPPSIEAVPGPAPIVRRGKISLSNAPSVMEQRAASWSRKP